MVGTRFNALYQLPNKARVNIRSWFCFTLLLFGKIIPCFYCFDCFLCISKYFNLWVNIQFREYIYCVIFSGLDPLNFVVYIISEFS